MEAMVDVDLNLNPRSLAKREQIIQAAQTLFLRDGFSRTSMESIRVEAGVSKPTLYNHFESKESLFIGIVEYSADHLFKTWDLNAVETTPVNNQQELHQILMQFASAAMDHLLSSRTVSLARVLLAETSTFPELGRNFRDRITRRVFTMLTTVLERASERGVISLDRTMIPAAVRAFTSQFLAYLLIDGLLIGGSAPEPPSKEDVERIVDLYMKMIC